MSEEEVMEANRRFYAALTDLDLEAMEKVWMHETWVHCVHPGWQILSGWEQVRESWARIFNHTVSHRVEPRNVSVRLFGELAWVVCLERITTPAGAGSVVSFAQGTNLFLRVPSGWRMILHHASIVPLDEPPLPGGRVH